MIVYVESNFVLEIALLQEQHSACEALLELCVTGRIQIVVPTYAMIEPFGALFRRRAERNVVKDRLDNVLRELGRSAPLSKSVEEAQVSLIPCWAPAVPTSSCAGRSRGAALRRWQS